MRIEEVESLTVDRFAEYTTFLTVEKERQAQAMKGAAAPKVPKRRR